MKKYVLGLFSMIVAFVLGVYIYLGGYRSVDVTQAELGPHRLVYRTHVGAYHQIVPAIEEVEKWAQISGEACRFSFGEFLSDPNNVAEDRLHSHAGCVVEKDWTTGLPENFRYREESRRLYVHAVFEGAPSIGPLKVYPRARKFLEAQGLVEDGPVIEMYEILPENKVRTQYLFPARPRG
jgi:AraC family transcriptional regulator